MLGKKDFKTCGEIPCVGRQRESLRAATGLGTHQGGVLPAWNTPGKLQGDATQFQVEFVSGKNSLLIKSYGWFTLARRELMVPF